MSADDFVIPPVLFAGLGAKPPATIPAPELARLLSVSAACVRETARTHQLPFTSRNGEIEVEAKDVGSWLDVMSHLNHLTKKEH
jgi:hypothetical protein